MNGVGTTLKAQLIQIDDLTRSYHVHCAKLEGELQVLRLENDRLARKLKDSGDYVEKYGKLNQKFEEFQASSNEHINSLSLKYQATNARLEECQAKLLLQSNGLQEEKVEKQSPNHTVKEPVKIKKKLKSNSTPVISTITSQDDEELKKLNLKLGTAVRENIKLKEKLAHCDKVRIELELENYTYRKEVKPLSADKFTDKEFDKSIEEKINKSLKKHKEKIAALEEERRELREAKAELQSQVDGYQLEKSLLQDCQDSKHLAKDRKKEIGKLKKEIEEITLDKDAVVFENHELRKRVGELKVTIAKLQEQVQEFGARSGGSTPDDEVINDILKEMCTIPILLSPEQMDTPEVTTWLDAPENDCCLSPSPELDMPDMDISPRELLTPVLSPKKVDKPKILQSVKSTEISRHCVKKHRSIPDILGTLRYLDKHRMFFTISNVPIKPVNKISRSSLTEIHENVNLVKSQKAMSRNSKCQLSCHVQECCDNSYFLLKSDDDESDLLGFYSVKDETKKKTLALPASEQKEQSRDHLLARRRERRNKLRKSRLSMSANMIIRKLNESMLLKRKKQIKKRNRRTTLEGDNNNEKQNVATSNTDESCSVQNSKTLPTENENHSECETSQPVVEYAESVLETQSVASEICDNDSDQPQDIPNKVEASTVSLDNKHMIKKSALSMLRQKIRKSSATPLWTGPTKRNAELTSQETTECSPRPTVKRISHEVSDKCKNAPKDSSDIVDSGLKTPTHMDCLLPTRRQSPRFLSSRKSPKLIQLNRESTPDEQGGESVETKSNLIQVVFDKVKSPVVQEEKPFAQIKIQPLQVEMPEVIPVEWTKKNGYFKVPSTALYENMKASLGKSMSKLSRNKDKEAPVKKPRKLVTPPKRLEQSEMACDKEPTTEYENPGSHTHLEDYSSPHNPPQVTPLDTLEKDTTSVTLPECKQSPQSPPLGEKESLNQPEVIPLEKLPDECEALRKKEFVSSCSKAPSPEKTAPLKVVRAKKIVAKRKQQPCDLVSQIEQAMSASSAKPPPAKIRKCAVAAPVVGPSVEEENQQCFLLDDSKSDEGPKKPLSKARIGDLFKKLMNYSNEEKASNEIAAHFVGQDSEFVAKVILGRIALDVHDKPDSEHSSPAPLMTQTQRVMLGFMVKLEKLGMKTIFSDFLKLAEQNILQTIELAQMLPITNLYMAVCKLKKDIHRMRRLCCEVAYFCDNLVVPFLFLVLGSWTDVLPHHNDIAKNPIAKVLVQIVYMKNCVTLPGYNLMALRDLLIKFYGYPTERWNSDEVFLQLYSDYLKKSDRTTDLPLLLFCKNHPEEWVYKKIDEYFKPLVSKVPTENSKATVIILIGHLSSWFSNTNKDQVEEWMESLIDDTTSDVVQRSIDLCLDKFQSN